MRIGVAALCCALLLAGCESGTLVNEEQTCQSAGGLFARERIQCTGSVERVSGSVQLGVIAGEDLDGVYRLDATITVAEGVAKAYATSSGGERVGGEVSPGDPLQIGAVVEPVDDEELDLALQAVGEEVVGLRYEATLVPQE